MIVKEVNAKTILSKSKVSDYTINPYVGCEHGCTYCYARFMKRFTGHKEKWGCFVDVKINAADLLASEIKKKRMGKVWISGICDPYQPIEEKYKLTKRCLKILAAHAWPVTIQTKSSLVLRDIEVLKGFNEIDVGIAITTADDNIRKVFEPCASSVSQRMETIEKLHSSGITVFAMIAPILPQAEGLVALLDRKVDYVLIDKMNYHYADKIYKENGLDYALDPGFFTKKKIELSKAFNKEGVTCQLLF
ncbi:MAG: radical SAM protein [Thermoplasmatales archaeon]|nr:MAG: radical SAM protein [Thermoplasmatales archaeon]